MTIDKVKHLVKYVYNSIYRATIALKNGNDNNKSYLSG